MTSIDDQLVDKPPVAVARPALDAGLADGLRAGRSVRMIVDGVSMYPALRPGDAVWLAPIRPEGPRVGEIVVCALPAGYLCHRVIWAARGRVRTKGDNNRGADPAQPVTALLGRVVAVERDGRRMDLTTSRAQAAAISLALWGLAEWLIFRSGRSLSRPLQAANPQLTRRLVAWQRQMSVQVRGWLGRLVG
ncbi:MAG: hypothetical protein Kow0047_02690 [Anaerolineae bacterium]